MDGRVTRHASAWRGGCAVPGRTYVTPAGASRRPSDRRPPQQLIQHLVPGRPPIAIQIDTATDEIHALIFQMFALTSVAVAASWKRDASARVDHSIPGQASRRGRLAYYRADKSRPSRQTRDVGYVAVGADSAARNLFDSG